MPFTHHARRAVSALAAAALLAGSAWGAQSDAGGPRVSGERRPSLSLKATPPLGFSPLRVHLAAEVRGGADDHPDFYCPTIEWEWGDGTISENTADCEPYEAGKSRIPRRFGVDHTYREPGAFRVVLRLKQKDKVVAASNVTIQVRAGAGQGE